MVCNHRAAPDVLQLLFCTLSGDSHASCRHNTIAVTLLFSHDALHALQSQARLWMVLIQALGHFSRMVADATTTHFTPQMVISTSDINRVTVVPPGVGRLFVLQARDLIKYQVTTANCTVQWATMVQYKANHAVFCTGRCVCLIPAWVDSLY